MADGTHTGPTQKAFEGRPESPVVALRGASPGLRIVTAYARNGYGGDRWSPGLHPTTFVTSDAAGLRPIGHFSGHSTDGDLWEVQHHGCAYRLVVANQVTPFKAHGTPVGGAV